jgi:hypothetical protein
MTDLKDTADTWFDDVAAALDMAQAHASSAWEMDFVSQQIDRFHRYGEKMFLSAKQADIIRRIGKLDQ